MAYAVDAHPALPGVRLPSGKRLPPGRRLAWGSCGILLTGGVLLALAGGTLSSGLLLMLGVTIAVVLAPELLLVLLVVAGGIKAAPMFAAVPVDMTLLAAFGTVVACAARLIRQGVPRIPMSAMGMLVLGGWVTLAALWSPDPSGGLAKALQFGVLTTLVFVAPIILLRTRESLEIVCGGLVAVGVLVALIVEPTGTPQNPLTIPGGNELEAAIYPGLAVVAIMGYLLFHGRGGRLRLLWLLPLPIVVPVWIGAGSRGILLAGVFAVVFSLIRWYIAHPGSRPLILMLLLVSVAIVAVQGEAIFGTAVEKYRRGLLTTDTGSALGERSYLMGQGVRIAKENPLGIGTGGYAVTVVRTPRKNSRLSYPHNIVVEFAAEQGVAAAGLFLGLVGAAWAARRRAPGGAGGAAGIFAGALVMFGVIESQFSFDIVSNRVLWFALGVAFATATFRRAAAQPRAPGAPT